MGQKKKEINVSGGAMVGNRNRGMAVRESGTKVKAHCSVEPLNLLRSRDFLRGEGKSLTKKRRIGNKETEDCVGEETVRDKKAFAKKILGGK